MKLYRIAALTAMLAVAAFTSGCLFVVEVEDTTVRAQNVMTDLTIRVDGIDFAVEYIDLYDVTIGDVFFSEVQAGDRATSYRVSGYSGSVDVYIGSASAKVYSEEYGFQTIPFSDMDVSGVNLSTGAANTVLFDEYTAGEIFAYY
jgi:hypothetical protein